VQTVVAPRSSYRHISNTIPPKILGGDIAPEGLPVQRKSFALLGYENLLTRQWDRVNTRVKSRKDSRVSLLGSNRSLVALRGGVRTEQRGGQTTLVSTFGLLYAMALVVPLTPALPASRPAAWLPLSTATA